MRLSRPTDADDQLVSEAIRELAQTTPSEHPMADPSFIWWKAQLLRRFEAEREATAPLDVGDRVHIGAAVLGAVALAVGAWDRVPALTLTPATALTVALAAVVVLSVFAFAAIEALRER